MPRQTTTEIHNEIQLIKKDLEYVKQLQTTMQEDVRDIKKNLLDPDSGAIARINRNTAFRKSASKALWSVWIAVLGIITKLMMDR